MGAVGGGARTVRGGGGREGARGGQGGRGGQPRGHLAWPSCRGRRHRQPALFHVDIQGRHQVLEKARVAPAPPVLVGSGVGRGTVPGGHGEGGVGGRGPEEASVRAEGADGGVHHQVHIGLLRVDVLPAHVIDPEGHPVIVGPARVSRMAS